MQYEVYLSQTAQKFLDALDNHIKSRITERIKQLTITPVPGDVKFITKIDGTPVFRFRIGKDYRALYSVNTNTKIILITKIDKRPRIYQKK